MIINFPNEREFREITSNHLSETEFKEFMKLYKGHTKEPFSLVDPVFRNVNRLFAFLFKNGNDNVTRDSLDKYYTRLVEINNFNALINNKPFSDQSVENKQEVYENLI